MIRLAPGDLIAIKHEQRHYYALVLNKISLFGGNLVFAFYETSPDLLTKSQIFENPGQGFFEIVDFIWAKRENRISRIASKISIENYLSQITYYKNTFNISLMREENTGSSMTKTTMKSEKQNLLMNMKDIFRFCTE